MYINVSLLSYVSNYLFLHDLQLFFKINYEIIFSILDDLSRSIFELKLRFKEKVIYEEILLNSINDIKVTMNFFDDSFETSVK